MRREDKLQRKPDATTHPPPRTTRRSLFPALPAPLSFLLFFVLCVSSCLFSFPLLFLLVSHRGLHSAASW